MNSTTPLIEPHSRDLRARSIAVVVPTYNERDNILAFYKAASSALAELDWQIIFVDDNSPDGTTSVAEELAIEDGRVRVIVRFHQRGLTSAVLQGVFSANTTYVVVTDADLQHDLCKIVEMLHLLNSDRADLVIGTRYEEGGSPEGLPDTFRIWLSSIGTKAARAFISFPVSDPMSGFFAFQRKKLLPILAEVDPLGFKVLFDILLIGGRQIRISEIAYRFRNRYAGSSKLDWRIQWDFLIQIIYHLLKQLVPHDLISFVLVGTSGAVVELAMLGLGVVAGTPNGPTQAAAIIAATAWNFVFNHLLTFHRQLRINLDLAIKFALYALAVAIGIIVDISAATFSLQKLNATELLASILGVGADTIWRFAVAKAIIWRL